MSDAPARQPGESTSLETAAFVDLSSFRNKDYDPGRGKLAQLLWYYCSLLLLESGWFPFRKFKVTILRMFGATIGEGVVIKPHVRIKYPWRLTVGDHCWIGQQSWIDNIEDVTIGSHVCISQLAYLCTGSHDHRATSFDLTAKPIVVQDGAWIAAGAIVLGGVKVGANTIVTAGSTVIKDLQPNLIVGGNPASQISVRDKSRSIS